MKKTILTFFIVRAFGLFAQTNLVPNNSFEIYSSCPLFAGELSKANGWFQPNIFPLGPLDGSTDYFNVCNNNFGGGSGIPLNQFGFQYARTGNAYAGFGPFVYSNLFTYREYLEVKFIDSLIKGRRYCLNYYLSLANTSSYAIGSIGSYFSPESLLYSSPNSENIQVIPQIENLVTSYLTDTLNWMLVEGEFIANGGERFLTIGNFRNNANTSYIQLSNTGIESYYYIDDISLIECEDAQTLTSSLTIPNVFTPNGDNTNDVFKPITKNIETLQCTIYNRWGIQVAELKEPSQVWDGRNTAGMQCTAGVYYYVLTAKGTDGKEYEEKGFVQLIR
jgi:gliding motility-associated-like protein